jgi:hypothetical protein
MFDKPGNEELTGLSEVYIAKLLANAGMQFEFVYDLYFAKQFIESNLTLKVLYISSWLYDTLSPFLLMNEIIAFCPIRDLRMTKRFVVKVFDFDMLYIYLKISYIIIIQLSSYLLCKNRSMSLVISSNHIDTCKRYWMMRRYERYHLVFYS